MCVAASLQAAACMGKQSTTDQGRARFPRMRIVSCDLTPGSRMVTSCPWKAYDYITVSMAMLLTLIRMCVLVVHWDGRLG